MYINRNNQIEQQQKIDDYDLRIDDDRINKNLEFDFRSEDSYRSMVDQNFNFLSFLLFCEVYFPDIFYNVALNVITKLRKTCSVDVIWSKPNKTILTNNRFYYKSIFTDT